MTDPRIDDLYKEIIKIKKAMKNLAAIVDAMAWRISTNEERKRITILDDLKKELK